MQIISIGDSLQKMSKPVFLKKVGKYFNLPSAEIFTQNAKLLVVYNIHMNNIVPTLCRPCH